ncbi:MAG TPA: WYL domain-containing protein [Thermoleophilia bacterium]|nr:WYL domain-containing protein [Thermoleophilia bacterium]
MPDAPIHPERTARALSLLSYLLAEERGDSVPLASVMRDLGVTRKQVAEDLSLLNLVNHGGGTYVIYGELTDDTIEVTREPAGDAMASPARLSPLMARALLLAVDLVGDKLPVDGRRTLTSIRDKVKKSIEGTDLPGLVEIETASAEVTDIIEVLNHGLRERMVVDLEYYTPAREELGRRQVEPYLLFDSNDAWYLEAYCRRVEAQRTFRIDLIRSAALTGEHFEPRASVDLSARRARALSVVPQHPRWAVVRFPVTRARSLEEQGLEVTRMEDGTVEARIPYLDERWLVREILRYAGEAVIVSPENLRRQVVEETRVIRSSYES